MSDDHEIRDLRRRLKLANRTMGKQGVTIAGLRGELARIREENSKLSRGDLRRLERFEETALAQFELDKERLEHASEEIKRLREKLSNEPGKAP